MKNKKIDPEESLSKYKTDLSEYSFMLEQEYKKKLYLNDTRKTKYDIIIKKMEGGD